MANDSLKENSEKAARKCRLCGEGNLVIVKESDLQGGLKSQDFAITDSSYGKTMAVYECGRCGLLQCFPETDLLDFYEGMSDEGYEETRLERSMQACKMLEILLNFKATGRLLDIGAGSGILVEEALKLGFEAEGVEPSAWLSEKARKLGLPIIHGSIPSGSLKPPYGIITLLDVIEHVEDPLSVLGEARRLMADDGYLCLTTPDVASFAARLMRWRWWHFRIAHVSYFNRKNLEQLLDKAGLEPVLIGRPRWYFTYEYLIDRVSEYVPFAKYFKTSHLNKLSIPLNLFDSYYVICKLK